MEDKSKKEHMYKSTSSGNVSMGCGFKDANSHGKAGTLELVVLEVVVVELALRTLNGLTILGDDDDDDFFFFFNEDRSRLRLGVVSVEEEEGMDSMQYSSSSEEDDVASP